MRSCTISACLCYPEIEETVMFKFKLMFSCIALLVVFCSQPAWSEPVVAGPLSITPGSASLVLLNHHYRLFLKPSFTFSIENLSSSDISIMLLANQVNAYDNFNQQLFNDMKSTGAPMSDKRIEKIFSDQKYEFVTLSPNQQIQVFVNVGTHEISMADKSQELYKTYRPTSACFNGAVGIIKIDGTTEVRTFSLTNMPLSVFAR